jgi:hypothetical protein
MPLQAFRSIPTNIVEWARYFTSLVITPDPGTITNDTFANRSAASVMGRAAATPGTPADIVAAADRRVLIRRSGVLQFDGLEVADLPSGVATEAEFAAADATVASNASAALAAHVAAGDPHPGYTTAAELAAAVSAHEAAGDPHTGYQKESEKDAASGYAGLNASSRTTKGVDTTDDVIVDDATNGLVLKDTQGTPHYWRVTVDNTGTLVITDVGTTKP